MAVAISDTAVTTRATSAAIKWVKPAPLWASQAIPLEQPWLAEFDGDRFLPDFLDLMASQTPADLASDTHTPKLTILDDKQKQLKLYQPLHGRYYLVTGSLVCRKLGLPDRSVLRKNGEKTSFVLRRLLKNVEYAWVKDSTVPSGGSWQPVGSNSLLKNEERQPMHPVKTCAPLPLTTSIVATPVRQPVCDQRTVYYGYIPVASREKYLMPAKAADIAQVLKVNGGDLRLEIVQTRVIDVWRGLYNDPNKSQLGTLTKEQHAQILLYLILDLGDFLNNYLPDVFKSLGTDGSGLKDSKKAKQKALFDELGHLYMPTTANKSGEITLANALYKLKDELSLLQGLGDEPTDIYDLYNAYHKDNNSPPNHKPISGDPLAYLKLPPEGQPPSAGGTLYVLFSDALNEGGTAVQVPPELADVIKVDPPNGDTYCLRLVYEHDPCAAVVSELSDTFTFAKAVDPDAPARHIRIELPSIKFKDLRKFKRGVGIQSTCEMNALTNQLLKIAGIDDISKKGKLTTPQPCGSGGGGGLDIGWICSFSLQILFIIAFILMFVFLIVLNIVFWWIAFFRICFPIPK